MRLTKRIGIMLLAGAMAFANIPSIKPLAVGSVVSIDKSTFPDETLRNYVSVLYDQDQDGVLSSAEVEAATRFMLNGNDLLYTYYEGSGDAREKKTMSLLNIQSLEGLDQLTNLKNITIVDYEISDRDAFFSFLKEFKNVEMLNISGLSFASDEDAGADTAFKLDAGVFPNLYDFNCGSLDLSELDVSSNTKLNSLNCDGNNLTTLDVSNNANLIGLSCCSNMLESLDVSGTKLDQLYCEGNDIEELTLVDSITRLNCSKNQLKIMIVPKNIGMLNVSMNLLTSIDVAKAENLRSINVSNNRLSELDLSSFENLTTVLADDNYLSAIDVSKSADLETLSIKNNKLEELDLKANQMINDLNCSGNYLLSLDVSGLLAEGNNLYVEANYNNRTIQVDETGKISLPATVKLNHMSDIAGAKISNGVIVWDGQSSEITYSYNIGKGKNVRFHIVPSRIVTGYEKPSSADLKTEEDKKDVPPVVNTPVTTTEEKKEVSAKTLPSYLRIAKLKSKKKGQIQIQIENYYEDTPQSVYKHSGAEILIAYNKSFKKAKKITRVTSSKSLSVKVSKMKKGKRCYVKMRSYLKIGGKKVYSKYCKIKNVKVKK